jgi:hypothetical protein
VYPEAEAVGVGLPPRSGGGGPPREVDVEHSTPEAAGTSGVVGRELDQGRGHGQKYGHQLVLRLSSPDGEARALGTGSERTVEVDRSPGGRLTPAAV